MTGSFLIKQTYDKKVVDLKGNQFAKLIQSASAFICAAGFETRAEQVPLAAKVARNPIVVAFANGPTENDKAFEKFAKKFEKIPGYDVCQLDLAQVEKFESSFESSLRQLRNFEGARLVIDISGLPNFAICITVMKVRQVFPTAILTLLYTEAEE